MHECKWLKLSREANDTMRCNLSFKTDRKLPL